MNKWLFAYLCKQIFMQIRNRIIGHALMYVRTRAPTHVPDCVHTLVRKDPIAHTDICANKPMHTQLTDCIIKNSNNGKKMTSNFQIIAIGFIKFAHKYNL